MNADQAIQLLNKRVQWMNHVNEVLNGLYDDQGKAKMYQAAETTARVLFQCLVHELVMSISRLLDSPETCGKENLSLSKVQSLIEQENFLLNQFIAIRRKIDQAFKPLMKTRNKIIAHHDLETWEQDRVKYEGVNKNSVDALIGFVIEYVNLANEMVRKTTMSWKPNSPSRGGPGAFLEKLAIESNKSV